jgi:hypothetical protein
MFLNVGFLCFVAQIILACSAGFGLSRFGLLIISHDYIGFRLVTPNTQHPTLGISTIKLIFTAKLSLYFTAKISSLT